MEIKDFLLKGPGIPFVLTSNIGDKFAQNPDTIILHFTAGGSVDSAVQTFKNPDTKVSAHMIVGRDGSVVQMVPFNVIAWHAGQSQYGDRTGFNRFSIGIEMDNAGPLDRRGDKYYSWFGREYPLNDVVYAVHRNEFTPRYWHAYTEIQIQKVMDICHLLVNAYGIKSILGHEEISPLRKTDPGPAFPLDKIRTRILESGRALEGAEQVDDLEMLVTADGLNIRELPDINSDKIAEPLVKNQKVKVLEKREGWAKVTTSITGWVAEKYLK